MASDKRLSKDDQKMLKQCAALFPVVLEQSHEVHIMTGAEIMELEKEYGDIEKSDKKLDPETKYPYTMPVQLAANHYRRLKNAWLKDGQPGVLKYMQGVAEVMKQNNENES